MFLRALSTSVPAFVLTLLIGVATVGRSAPIASATTFADPDTLQITILRLSSAVFDYIETHSDSDLQSVRTQGKELSQLIRDYQRSSAQENPALNEALRGLKESTVALLSTEAAEQRAYADFLTASQTVSQGLDELVSTIRPNQLSAQDRWQVILEAARQTNAIGAVVSEGLMNQSTGDDRLNPSIKAFGDALDRYEALSQSQRAHAARQQVQGWFDRQMNAARETLACRTDKEKARVQFLQALQAVAAARGTPTASVIPWPKRFSDKAVAAGLATAFVFSSWLAIGFIRRVRKNVGHSTFVPSTTSSSHGIPALPLTQHR